MSVAYGSLAFLYFVIIYINVAIHFYFYFASPHFCRHCPLPSLTFLFLCYIDYFLLSSLSLYKVPKRVLFLYF